MARNRSGFFNRVLNFIGLVDDGDTGDTYGEEYQNGNYGRQGAYTPARPQRASAARSTPSRTDSRRTLPQSRPSRFDDRTQRSSRYAEVEEGYEDYGDTRRSASRFDEEGYEEEYTPRPSRSANPPARRSGAGAPQSRPQPPQRVRVSQRSRTVMYSLRTLEDCCDVIDQLIANNTVVLTMDELDGRLLQRAVDTLSGAVFALHASIRKASDKTYLVAPMSVEVNDAYDVERGFR